MNRVSVFAETFVRGFKILVRDIVCPIVGLYLVVRLGQGTFNVAAIPVIGGLASALIGIPYWSRTDERKRGEADTSDKEQKRRKQVTISGSGIRWGSDDDERTGS